MACAQDKGEHDLCLTVKTPFRNGVITINKNGDRLSDLNVLGDSGRNYVFYGTKENSKFEVVITRAQTDTGVGYATLAWTYVNRNQNNRIYFDTLTFSARTTDPYIAKE